MEKNFLHLWHPHDEANFYPQIPTRHKQKIIKKNLRKHFYNKNVQSKNGSVYCNYDRFFSNLI